VRTVSQSSAGNRICDRSFAANIQNFDPKHSCTASADAVLASAVKTPSQVHPVSTLPSLFHSSFDAEHLLRVAVGATSGNIQTNLPSTTTGSSPTFDRLAMLKAVLSGPLATNVLQGPQQHQETPTGSISTALFPLLTQDLSPPPLLQRWMTSRSLLDSAVQNEIQKQLLILFLQRQQAFRQQHVPTVAASTMCDNDNNETKSALAEVLAVAAVLKQQQQQQQRRGS
jgi:hypothetical protein